MSQASQLTVQPVAYQTGILNRDLDSLIKRLDQVNIDRAHRQDFVNGEIRDMRAAVDTSAEKDTRSEQDRAELNSKVNELQRQGADLASVVRGNSAEIQQRLVEIETQFRAVGEIENGRWNELWRLFAAVWEHSGLGRFPDRPNYQPNIAPPPVVSGR